MKTLFILFLFANISYAATPYEKLQKRLDASISTFKHLKPFELGVNDQKNLIKGAIYRGSAKNKTKHLIVAAHHGNETLSSELALKFIEYIGKKGDDLFKDKDLYIIPVLNIGGFNSRDRHEYDNQGDDHDPNRDYPDPCIKKKNFKLKSTSLLASFVESNEIVGAITIHGYYGSLTYPWGIFTDDYETIDHAAFNTAASSAVTHNQYQVGTHADILYPAGGAFEDWAYFKLGVWSLLVELENRPNYENDIKMMVSSIRSFPKKRSLDHRHLGNCTLYTDFGISRP